MDTGGEMSQEEDKVTGSLPDGNREQRQVPGSGEGRTRVGGWGGGSDSLRSSIHGYQHCI